MPQKVNYKDAAECVAAYRALYQSNDLAGIQRAFSTSVSFPMAMVKDLLTLDAVKIEFGVYTANFAKLYPGAVAGRLTAFLYPATVLVAAAKTDGESDDTPPSSDPLNMGDLLP